MPVKFKNDSHNVTIPLEVGKFYVVDAFSGPCEGPFDNDESATKACNESNIADDCSVAICRESGDGKVRLHPV